VSDWFKALAVGVVLITTCIGLPAGYGGEISNQRPDAAQHLPTSAALQAGSTVVFPKGVWRFVADRGDQQRR
jgi:hypothetical protein